MTRALFRDDPYQREAHAIVLAHTEEGGIVLDQTVFYPTGGGQMGDSGALNWANQRMEIATTVKGPDETIVLVPAEPVELPPVDSKVHQTLDWDRRYSHMRVHTALHLLSVVLPYGVTGGSISVMKGRLDFNMDEAPGDREDIEEELNQLVERDLKVSEEFIDEAVLTSNPRLVKTMHVMPPRGSGQIRLVRIGAEDHPVDLQPCGGTHVARTGEIGRLRLGKIEKKGRMNRRVNIHLDN